jgi:hypothetical protein
MAGPLRGDNLMRKDQISDGAKLVIIVVIVVGAILILDMLVQWLVF